MFALIFNAASNAMAFTEPVEGRIVDVNESWLRVSGCTREQAIGRTALELGLWYDAGERDALRAQLAAEGRLTDLETRLRLRGAVRTILVSAEIIQMNAGPHVLWEFRDITDRRKAEEEGARLREQLAQTQKIESIGTLAGGVAHDFNNILGAIILQLDLLRTEYALAPAVAEVIDEIQTAAERAARLTQQLLAFSRKRVLSRHPCDLHAIIAGHLKMLRRLINETISIEVSASPETAQFNGDAPMIEQVVMNLCLNARDAMPQGGRLLIITDVVELDEEGARQTNGGRAGRFARLRVSDTGTGMDAETCHRVFEPFFTTKEVGQGTGLGLSTAHGIVAQHDGWIDVRSEPGSGTEFSVYLPAHAGGYAESSADNNLRPVHSVVPGSNATILVVEDEDAIRRIAVRALAGLGYHVLEASNGVEALEAWKARNGRVDLLLTDMVMPGGISGLLLAQTLRRERPDLPVVVTSGYSAELLGEEGDLPEGSIFLPKPVSLNQLGATIRQLIDAAQQLPA